MFEKVRDIIVDTLSCEMEDVTMEADLAEDLGADSLDAVEPSPWRPIWPRTWAPTPWTPWS